MADQDAEAPVFTMDAIHMMRTAQQLQVQMSAMADQKASILMGATFVVFTLAITQLARGDVSAPLIVLGGFALVAAMLAIFAIMPAVTPPRGLPLNLMFFGSFTQLPEDEFVARTLAVAASQKLFFEAMARDTYQNGCVLRRKKYFYLGLAYRVFLVGLVATAVVLVVDWFR